MKRKICVVTAGRADYTRIRSVLWAIQKDPDLDLQLIVMGTHLLERFGNTIDMIREDGFPIAEMIHMIIEGETSTTMSKSIGLGIIEVTTAFNNLKPDIVIALTDRFEALIVGIVSAFMNICLVHLQGGEVTGSIDESIRHALTKFSNYHLPSTAKSAERIIKMGEPADRVFNVGCPSMDIIVDVPKKDSAATLQEVNVFGKELRTLNPHKPYLLALQHPVTTEFSECGQHMDEILKAIHATQIQTVMLWPNVDAGAHGMVQSIRKFLREHEESNLFIFKHFPFSLFVNLMRNAACMVGNSSAMIREACAFGTPAVNVGTRELGREKGQHAIDVGYSAKEIQTAIEAQLRHGPYVPEYLYGDGCSAKRIIEILKSADIKNIQKKLTY